MYDSFIFLGVKMKKLLLFSLLNCSIFSNDLKKVDSWDSFDSVPEADSLSSVRFFHPSDSMIALSPSSNCRSLVVNLPRVRSLPRLLDGVELVARPNYLDRYGSLPKISGLRKVRSAENLKKCASSEHVSLRRTVSLPSIIKIARSLKISRLPHIRIFRLDGTVLEL